MRKYFMGVATHASTTLLIFVLELILRKLSGIYVRDYITDTIWIRFSIALLAYIVLGNLYYMKMSIREKIISTAVVMVINAVMGILIKSSTYDVAFITLLIHASFNDAFFPLSMSNEIKDFSILTVIPLLLLINIEFPLIKEFNARSNLNK